jgi:hypothetical protein
MVQSGYVLAISVIFIVVMALGDGIVLLMVEPALSSYFTQQRMRLTAAWRAHVPMGQCGFHDHDAIELVYQIGGHGVITVRNGQTVTVDGGTATILPANVEHDQQQLIAGEGGGVFF